MSEARCYHCQTLLGDINAACPNCLPNRGRTYAPVSWEEEQYLHVKHENQALRAEIKRLREALEIVTARLDEGMHNKYATFFKHGGDTGIVKLCKVALQPERGKG